MLCVSRLIAADATVCDMQQQRYGNCPDVADGTTADPNMLRVWQNILTTRLWMHVVMLLSSDV